MLGANEQVMAILQVSVYEWVAKTRGFKLHFLCYFAVVQGLFPCNSIAVIAQFECNCLEVRFKPSCNSNRITRYFESNCEKKGKQLQDKMRAMTSQKRSCCEAKRMELRGNWIAVDASHCSDGVACDGKSSLENTFQLQNASSRHPCFLWKILSYIREEINPADLTAVIKNVFLVNIFAKSK